MKDKIFGFAIIGCGAIARIHAEAIASLENDRRPFVDEKEGRKGVELILAAYRSEKTGQKQFLRG